MPFMFIDPKRIFAKPSKVRLHGYALIATLLLCCGLTFAQNVDSPRVPTGTATPSPVRQTPTPTPTPQTTEQPRRAGGGSFGINIDIGSVINLLREVTKKDEKCEPEVEQGARRQYSQTQELGLTVEQFVKKACEAHNATHLQRNTEIKTLSVSSKNSTQKEKSAPISASCKVNGNFEMGNFTAWTGANNGPNSPSRTKANLPLITTLGISSGAINLDTSHQTIVYGGDDPILGALLPQVRPGGGGSAARIGNAWRDPSYYSGFGAELLSKTFTVTAADSIVGFSYAVVMADGGADHKPGGTAINPRFMVRVLNSVGTDITNNIAGGRVRLDSGSTPNILESDVNNPFFKSFTMPSYTPVGASKVVTPLLAYKDWSCSEINLSDMVGEVVTVEFITQDCDASGHFAYAYIDDFCTTCGPGPEGSIKLAESDKCGAGKVCVDVTVPKTGTATGQATASLDIWQNGNKLTTYTSPAISADGKVCFPINPSTIPGLDKTKGFDYSAQASMTIVGASGPYSLPTKLLGSGPDGLQPGRNNDYTPSCGVVVDAPLCITCLCGHPGQPVCPACGQAGQPLCAQSCLAADYVQPISLPKPDISPKTRNAVGNATSKAKK